MSSSCRIAGGVERLAATIGKRAETRAASQFHYDEQEMFNAELQKARRENWLSIVANKLRIVRANRYKIDDLPDYKLTPVAVAQPTKAATHADTALGKSWAAAATEFTATQAIKDLRPATIAEENYYKEAFEEPLPPRDADTIDGDPNDMARKPDTKIGRRWWLAASIRDLNTGQIAQARADYEAWYNGKRKERYKGKEPFNFEQYVKYRISSKAVPPGLDTSSDFSVVGRKPLPAKPTPAEPDIGYLANLPPWMLDEYGWEPDYGEDFGKLKARERAIKGAAKSRKDADGKEPLRPGPRAPG
jgi:hypothetical protein